MTRPGVWLAAALAIAMGPAPAMALPAAAADVRLVVSNVKAGKGHVRASLCDEARFGKEGCPYHEAVAANGETVELVFEGIPPGRYAIQVLDDENDNEEMDFTSLGLPEERFGFSNNVRPIFSMPAFERAAFTVGADDVTLTIKLLEWN